MNKVIAKYQITVPSILMAEDRVLKLEPIKLETEIGEVAIYPPGCKDKKPDNYIETKESRLIIEGGVESKESKLWDADTLWVDVQSEVPNKLSNEEMRVRLDREMHKVVYRFLRFLRKKLPETPFTLPASLQYSTNLYWDIQPSGLHIATMVIPAAFRLVSHGAELTEDKWKELHHEMSLGLETELYEDFIVDAKVALEEDDLNRAILYAAIACEIFIKEYCEKAAKEAGISQKFWKYLKSRRPRVVDYYDSVLHLVKKHSLQAKNQKLYKLLDRLYDARNEIMHEGRLSTSRDKDEINQLREDVREAEQVISWVRGL
jgi:hypothetical protein